MDGNERKCHWVKTLAEFILHRIRVHFRLFPAAIEFLRIVKDFLGVLGALAVNSIQ
jgi:hypothetical protein